MTDPTPPAPETSAAGTGWRFGAILAGPLVAIVLMLLPHPDAISEPAWRLVAIITWIVIWWLTEAIPIPATALLPVAAFPVLGIVDLKTTSANYAHPLLLMFLGGFILAVAMQHSGLHRRIALTIISYVGTSPTMIVAGFMIATASLSMWISNTATTIMMFAVALPVIQIYKDTAGNTANALNFSVALMLSIAYSASIGGLGTPIGTPTTALLVSILHENYNIEINFALWMLLGIPVVAVMLPITWFLLTRIMFPIDSDEKTRASARETVQSALKALGAMRRHEAMVLGVFILAALGWILGKPIAKYFGIPFSDTTVAIVAALLLFMLPYRLDKPTFLMDWEATRDVPWGILLMLGGGLAIASAINSTGLAETIGAAMSGFSIYGLWIFVLLFTVLIVFMTELTSNFASAATFLPVLGAIAVGMGVDPRLLMIPVTLGASMAFMMPIATAPNAVVFSHPDVKIKHMVRTGIWLNFASIVVCFVAGYWLASWVFGLSTH